MKRLIPLLLLLPTLALGASRAVGPAGATTQTANSAAGNVPTAASDGITALNQCTIAVRVCAASGQTLSGGGTLVFWTLPDESPAPAVWATHVEGTNPSMAGAAGLRCVTVFTREINPRGRIYVEADTVTASGGALTVVVTTSSCKGTTAQAPASGSSGGMFAVLDMARKTVVAQPKALGGIAGVVADGQVAYGTSSGLGSEAAFAYNATTNVLTVDRIQLIDGPNGGTKPITFASGSGFWSSAATDIQFYLGSPGTSAYAMSTTGFTPGANNVYTLGGSTLTWASLYLGTTNNSGTPGNTTINTAKGRLAIAAGTATATVTNSRSATAGSCIATANTNDATCWVKSCVPGAGSFVVTMNANCTAATSVDFVIFQ